MFRAGALPPGPSPGGERGVTRERPRVDTPPVSSLPLAGSFSYTTHPGSPSRAGAFDAGFRLRRGKASGAPRE